MDILNPWQNPFLTGHNAATRQFEESYMTGRMHHAWLISGIEGIGKATLAYHMAHFVLSGGMNPIGKLNMQNPAARLIAAEAHPDLFVLQRPIDDKTSTLKDSIPVEDARKIAPFMHMTASHGGWRIAIIDEAHTLNRHGQNAILKVIEEPPEKCLILLTVTTPGILLPTIRSRCRILSLLPLSETDLRTVLLRCGADTDNLDRVISLSSGSAGFALTMLLSESLPLYEETLALLQDLPELDMGRLHGLADRIGRKADTDRFGVITKLLTETLRRTVRAKAAGEPISSDFSAKLAHGKQLDRILQLWEKISQTFAMAEGASLDRKLAFINAISEIRHVAA